jgi:hypothetical protein
MDSFVCNELFQVARRELADDVITPVDREASVRLGDVRVRNTVLGQSFTELSLPMFSCVLRAKELLDGERLEPRYSGWSTWEGVIPTVDTRFVHCATGSGAT